MKLYTLLLFVVACSFTPVNNFSFDTAERLAKFKATLNGIPFQMMEDRIHPATLVTKAGSLNGRAPAQTLITVSFVSTGEERNNELMVDNLQFDIIYETGKTAYPAKFNVAMQYMGGSYFPLLENSQLIVTQLFWGSDKKHFEMSANFNCILRSYGYPVDGLQDITLKGSIHGIRVDVPAWVATR